MSLRSSAGSPATGTPAGGAADRRPGTRKRKSFLGPQPLGLLFSAPYVIYVLGVLAFPLGYAVYISFHDFFFTAPRVKVDRPFVGLDNYVTILSDPAVQRSFLNIGVFLVINVPLTVGLSLLLANALNRITRLRTFFRLSYYVPYVTASVAVVGVWLFLFQQNGLINGLLGPLAPSPSWLVNSWLAMPTVALYVTWKQLGFFILLYLAALQNIPDELYESAAVDGGSKWVQFWNITVPGVRPASVLVTLLATITGANLFTEPYLLTGGGGPDGASASPVFIMYQKGILQGNPDVAAALGVVLVIGVLLIALIQKRLVGGKED
ncbi:sugar ABC transporter permease [Arthrobacter sp. BB-1]|uniref:carbohydrate ABC transporter permease n=1 Tax=unclassified Arthrobacter TaxID=235627 RepID=UPI0010E28146|nr:MULTISPECIES: sugar ABC transporter permease [unclassified Arthrobacter]TNB69226.1 sugar ABC transporter permease [Arthrobacter sp. BB-1]VII98226.1 ABC transporter, permease protein 1 (cluster 1, maltose/g3p/polyamine/iron) [Arthrobacter sp. DR-2P]